VRRNTKLAALLAAILLAVPLMRPREATSVLSAPARRFFHCYRALGASEARVNAWERVVFSLAMASAASMPSRPPAPGAPAPPTSF